MRGGSLRRGADKVGSIPGSWGGSYKLAPLFNMPSARDGGAGLARDSGTVARSALVPAFIFRDCWPIAHASAPPTDRRNCARVSHIIGQRPDSAGSGNLWAKDIHGLR